MIFAVDPGTYESAYCILDSESLKPIKFGKVQNDELLARIISTDVVLGKDHFSIEMIDSYGMAVGKEVFDTCVWVGRFTQEAIKKYESVEFIYRKDEKLNLCGTMKAKDKNIRQALIDRFGVVGTKKNPGWFYGVSADVWSAIAVGVTFYDKLIGKYKA